jgi:FKBP-type peptidyl-prolyl cis-trans isomerase
MKKQVFYSFTLLAFLALAVSSCKDNGGYQKTKSGVMYKVYPGDSKDTGTKTGSVMKLNFVIKLGKNDSVLQSTYDEMPLFLPIEGNIPPDAYSPIEVFPKLRKGDSAVIVQLVDTLMKRAGPNQLPPFFKKGDRLTTYVKVVDVFASQEAATPDRQAEISKAQTRRKAQVEEDLKKGIVEMEEYLKKKNINATKTGTGSFVVVKEQGNGIAVDSGKYVSVRFAGRTLRDDKEFQSTMAPTETPFTFRVGYGGSIPGLDEGVRLFKKGGKGTLYLPGALCYGRNPPQGSPFKVNDALIFDIDVVEVSDSQPAADPMRNLPPQLREQMEKQAHPNSK